MNKLAQVQIKYTLDQIRENFVNRVMNTLPEDTDTLTRILRRANLEVYAHMTITEDNMEKFLPVNQEVMIEVLKTCRGGLAQLPDDALGIEKDQFVKNILLKKIDNILEVANGIT